MKLLSSDNVGKSRLNYVELLSGDRKSLLDENRAKDIKKTNEDRYQRWKSTYKEGDLIPVEYQNRHLNESSKSDNRFSTILGESLQLPLRYMTRPDKMIGDAATSISPNSWVAKNFDNTYKDRLQHREIMNNPKYSTKQKLGHSLSTGVGMANEALLGELAGYGVAKIASRVAPKIISPIKKIFKPKSDVVEPYVYPSESFTLDEPIDTNSQMIKKDFDEFANAYSFRRDNIKTESYDKFGDFHKAIDENKPLINNHEAQKRLMDLLQFHRKDGTISRGFSTSPFGSKFFIDPERPIYYNKYLKTNGEVGVYPEYESGRAASIADQDKQYLINTKKISGFSRNDKEGVPYNYVETHSNLPKLLNTSVHEAGHGYLNNFRRLDRTRNGETTVDPAWVHKNLFDKFKMTKGDNDYIKWSGQPEEHIVSLWGNRATNKMGYTNPYTEKQAEDFIKRNAGYLYDHDISKNPEKLKAAKEFIMRFGVAAAPVGVGLKSTIQNNK